MAVLPAVVSGYYLDGTRNGGNTGLSMSKVSLVKRCLRCGAQNEPYIQSCAFCGSSLLTFERGTNEKPDSQPNAVRLEVLTPGWPITRAPK